MPWDCKNCLAPNQFDDVSVCSECGTEKTAWTMVADQTRQMTITRSKKLQLLRSDEPGEALGEGETYEGVALSKATSAPAIPKAQALKLFEDGKRPAPGDLLFCRLFPGGHEDLCLTGTVLLQTAEPADSEVDPGAPELTEEGSFDVPFLLVYGEEELDPEVRFDGIELIDVTEATDLGHAPKFGVAALGKKRRDLPIQGLKRVLRFSCDRLTFNTDSAILRPEGLVVLKGVLQQFRSDPSQKLLITAHTDTKASDEYNQALSEARAKNVLDFLVGDEEAWLEDVKRKNSHLAQDVRDVLEWGAFYWGFDCTPPDSENAPLGAKDREAISAFKGGFNRRFSQTHLTAGDVEGAADEQFWRRVLNLYAHAMVDLLELGSGAELQALCDSLVFVDDAHRAIGCGEKYQLVATEDDEEEERNRRLDFLFFPEGQAPEPEGENGDYLKVAYDESIYAMPALGCPEPEIFGAVPPNVVFVIDVSGSMAYYPPPDPQPTADRIGFAQRKLIQVISELRDEDTFTVIAYSSAVDLLWPTDAGLPQAKVANTDHKREAIAWVRGLKAVGLTHAYDALELALQTVDLGEGPRGIKFLSDGEPSPPQEPDVPYAEHKAWEEEHEAEIPGWKRDEKDRILQLVRDADEDWVLDTIGFFASPEDGVSEGERPLVEFMKSLADVKPGQFTHVYVPIPVAR